MGYAKDLYDMISHRAIKDTDDDQLYFTNIYLDEKLRVSQCFVITYHSNHILLLLCYCAYVCGYSYTCKCVKI